MLPGNEAIIAVNQQHPLNNHLTFKKKCQFVCKYNVQMQKSLLFS